MVRFNSSGHETDKRQKIMNTILIAIFAAIVICSTILLVVRISKIDNNNIENNQINTQNSVLGAEKKVSSSYAVMEGSRNILLDGQNASSKLPMASTTKIMTAYIACTSGKLNDIVEIPKAVVGVEGSSVYLKEGEKYKLIDLVYGLMLQSGNDAAEAIARYLGGSIEGFANIMNETAVKMGLKSTHFVNPHGLHDDEHYTSAYDLAYITCEGLKNEEFAKICSTKVYKFQLQTGENKCYVNKNKLLNLYDGCIGVKTGFTKKAGRCLVSAAKRNGVTIVSVVLNHYDMWNSSMANLNRGFAVTKSVVIAKANQCFAQVKSSSGQILNLSVAEDVVFAAMQNENLNITYDIKLLENLPENIQKGEIVGEIKFFNDKHLLFVKKIYTI